MSRPQDAWFPEAPSAEIAELVEQVCHGELSEEHGSRLKTLVSTDERARQFYVRYMNMHASLPSLLGASEAELLADEAKVYLSERSTSNWIHRRGVRASIWGAAIAVNVVLVFLLALAVSPGLREQIGWEQEPDVASTPSNNRVEPTDASAIRLIRAQDCRWAGAANLKPRIGSDLNSRVLQLESGVAELACGEGVRLAIHGPTKIQIDSSKNVTLTVGNLLVRAEGLGRGFTVATPTATIIDLGTEFGVSLEENGQHEVQVFEGSVEVRSTRPRQTVPAVKLVAGEATKFEADASPAEIQRTKSRADATRFVWASRSSPVSSFPATERLLKGSPLRLVSGGKPVTGTGTFDTSQFSFSPSAVTDGRLRDLGTGNDWSYWVASDGASDATLTVDLLEECEIAEIRLQPTHNAAWQNRGTKDFRLLVSADGKEFVEVVRGTLPCVFNQTDVSTERYPLVQPVCGRYVKFESLSWYGMAAGLNEIQAFVQPD